MGKALITGGGTAGSYTIKLDTGKATQTARLAAIDARLAALVPLIAAAQGYLSVQFVLEAAQEAAVQTCISNYIAATRATPVNDGAVKSALDAYTAAAAKLQSEKALTAQEQLKVDILLSEQTQLTKDRAKWASMVLEITQQAWCADLTEDAAGTVATVEIPGEDKLVLIAPAAPSPAVSDGLLTSREVQSPEQVFWNAAALPGAQKWKPTYRRGTITAVNLTADQVDVALDDDPSSAQKLKINQTDSLTAVPVQYMTCNAHAFEVGDRCVVKFTDQDWSKPKVVGFESHPKPCTAALVSGMVALDPKIANVVSAETTVPGAYVGALHQVYPEAYVPRGKIAGSGWHDDERLVVPIHPDVMPIWGKTGDVQTKYITPALYSGKMAKAVQLLLAMPYDSTLPTPPVQVRYNWRWACTHGICTGTDGRLWLVEISSARGVLAMRLPTQKLKGSGPDVQAARAMFSDAPTGGMFPTGSALTAAIAAGTVLQLISASGLSAFYDNTSYSTWMGWTFNMSGTEAHNTCHTPEVGVYDITGYHYKIAFVFSAAEQSAELSLVASGSLMRFGEVKLVGGSTFYATNVVSFYTEKTTSADGTGLDPFSYGVIPRSGSLGYPSGVDGSNCGEAKTPVLVCFVDDVLEVVYQERKLINNTNSVTHTTYPDGSALDIINLPNSVEYTAAASTTRFSAPIWSGHSVVESMHSFPFIGSWTSKSTDGTRYYVYHHDEYGSGSYTKGATDVWAPTSCWFVKGVRDGYMFCTPSVTHADITYTSSTKATWSAGTGGEVTKAVYDATTATPRPTTGSDATESWSWTTTYARRDMVLPNGTVVGEELPSWYSAASHAPTNGVDGSADRAPLVPVPGSGVPFWVGCSLFGASPRWAMRVFANDSGRRYSSGFVLPSFEAADTVYSFIGYTS